MRYMINNQNRICVQHPPSSLPLNQLFIFMTHDAKEHMPVAAKDQLVISLLLPIATNLLQERY